MIFVISDTPPPSWWHDLDQYRNITFIMRNTDSATKISTHMNSIDWILSIFIMNENLNSYLCGSLLTVLTYFLSTGGTSTGEPVCLCVFCFTKKLEIGLVIIVYTPVLSTTGSYWFLLMSHNFKFIVDLSLIALQSIFLAMFDVDQQTNKCI